MTFQITIDTDDATAALLEAEANAQGTTVQALVERLAGKVVAGWAERAADDRQRLVFDGLRVAAKEDPAVFDQLSEILSTATAAAVETPIK